MDKQGREYKYQADFTLPNQMFHVRCDDWEEFKEAVANLQEEFMIVKEAAPTASIPVTTATGGLTCAECGAPVGPEKQIMWKEKPFWTRDCSSGMKHKTGFFRKAS